MFPDHAQCKQDLVRFDSTLARPNHEHPAPRPPETTAMAELPPPAAPPRHPNTSVVLLAPELFVPPPDRTALQTSLAHPHGHLRLLIRLAAATDLPLAQHLAQAGIAIELLVPAGITLPPTDLPLAHMPPGSTDSDTDELALALADVLLVPANPPDLPLIRLADRLKKHLLTPGARSPALGVRRNIARRLDPETPGLHRCLRRFWGRWEQFYLELAAFNWRGYKHGGIARSRSRLRECLLGRAWPHTPHFAPEEPDNWKHLAPDRAALDPATSPIVASFDRLDRSALHGSYIHRDLSWAAYLAAAFAVLFAVAGSIRLFPILPEWIWPAGELVALFIILLATIFTRTVGLQDRWTACRFGAEQLRIARMCLPLLVVPSALCSVDTTPKGDDSLRALAEVKRAVRDQGLPRLAPSPSPIDAARWVALVVGDQFTYHHDNYHKLHCAEQRLNYLTIVLFALAFIAVCWHLKDGENNDLLLATAAGPAFAASMHGIATRLGFVHRIQLSHDAERELAQIRNKLHAVIAGASDSDATWIAVRKLAFQAAEAMGQETRSWHSQVRRQKDELT